MRDMKSLADAPSARDPRARQEVSGSKMPSSPAPSQRRRSPDQKDLPLNATCLTARIRPQELT
jgi:hypothetical protein